MLVAKYFVDASNASPNLNPSDRKPHTPPFSGDQKIAQTVFRRPRIEDIAE